MEINWNQIRYSRVDYIEHEELTKRNLTLGILREDLLHPNVSGNKFRKLKYNILEAKKRGYKKILTFGGAYSNHISATASACQLSGLQSLGIIRGEELEDKIIENSTLSFAKSLNMKLIFVNRSTYKKRSDEDYIKDISAQYPDYYIVPEGGSNDYAIKGCEEILYDELKIFDYVCTAVGTAGTFTGLLKSSHEQQSVLGFCALKGINYQSFIENFTLRKNYQIFSDFNFGGFAKVSDELISFINCFNKGYGILLDPIYTGKMMFSILKLIQNNFFREGTKILAIHTGGLQAIEGMNKELKRKNKSIIE